MHNEVEHLSDIQSFTCETVRLPAILQCSFCLAQFHSYMDLEHRETSAEQNNVHVNVHVSMAAT